MSTSNINLKTIKKINKNQTTSDNSTFFSKICRFLSYYVTFLFLKLNISSNATTYLNFILGIVMFIFFIKSTFLFYIFAIIILFFTYILDCVDGNISRLKKNIFLLWKVYRFTLWYNCELSYNFWLISFLQ